LPIDWTSAIRNRNGSTAVEYAVLLALMLLVVTAPLMLMGKTVSKTFIDVDGAFVSSSRSPAGNPSAVRGSSAAPANAPSARDSFPTGSIGSSEGALPTSQVAGLSASLLATAKDRTELRCDYLPEISLFLLKVLLIIPLYLLVRRAAGRGVIVSRQFVDLAYALINDAVCIVSPHVKVRMGGNDSVREMMKGIECLGPRAIPSSSVSEKSGFARRLRGTGRLWETAL
jgi:Flp pilus assembly pilin Flp